MHTWPYTELHQALVGMGTIQHNTLDSTQGLFGVIEHQYLLNTDTVHQFLKDHAQRYTVVAVSWLQSTPYYDTYLDRTDDMMFHTFRKKSWTAPVWSSARSTLRVRTRWTSQTQSFQIITSDCPNQWPCRKTVYHHLMDRDWPLMTHTSLDFLNGVRASIYHQLPWFIPVPTLTVTFDRIILYNASRNERVNIDYNHEFSVLGYDEPYQIKGQVIVESKSLDWWSSIDQILKKYPITRLPYTSKYALGRCIIEERKAKGDCKRVIKAIEKLT